MKFTDAAGNLILNPFPREDVRTDLLADGGQGERHPLFGSVELLDLQLGGRREPAFATRHPDVPEMRDLLGLDWRRIDRLYEEDELVAHEAIDPYHRIDVRDSSRKLRISDRLHEDLVWRYPTPREDGRRVAGRYAVHHERCHTEVDGRPLGDGRTQ
jgi:uncharacterized protein (DUF427 family)